MVCQKLLVFDPAAHKHLDKSKYGPDADIFRLERWLDKDAAYPIPPPYHFSYGAGGRMCTTVNFSNIVLYSIFFRLIPSFKICGSGVAPPPTHYIDYNRNTTAAAAIPKDFKAKFVLRNSYMLARCFETLDEATGDFAGAERLRNETKQN
jgi:phenylacetate 2-hydroxylase